MYKIAYLHPVCHSPPFSDLRVCSHTFHIALKIGTDILEGRENGAVVIEKDGV